MLLLSLGLPKRLRQYDLTDAIYRVYSLVRSVRRRGEQPRVGVMFFGKHPPRGFSERPGARFLLPSDSIVNAVPPAGLRDGNTPYSGLPALSRPAGAETRRSTRWSERAPAPLPGARPGRLRSGATRRRR